MLRILGSHRSPPRRGMEVARGWLVAIWLLMTPLDDPREWVWTIIGAYETGSECEGVRSQRLDQPWVLCAFLRG